MADRTTIEWTDATVNFWWGCTKVGPGCEHCYAESWAKRTGGNHWGVGVPRRKIASAVKTLHRLNNGSAWWAADCQIGKLHDHQVRRVFIQSMSDLFDKEVPVEWFDEAWDTITACDHLEIQIVTKRISFVEKRLNGKPWPKHAGLIISVVNQEEADRDIPRLIELKRRLGIPWVGLSMEPLLGGVDLEFIELSEPVGDYVALNALTGSGYRLENEDGDLAGDACEFEHLDWVIVGGESGGGARPINPQWVRDIRDQCEGEDIPFLFKQWGEWAPADAFGAVTWGPVTDQKGNVRNWLRQYVVCADRADRLDAHSFTEHSTDLVFRVGKKRAGRRLDNALHDGFPA